MANEKNVSRIMKIKNAIQRQKLISFNFFILDNLLHPLFMVFFISHLMSELQTFNILNNNN